MGKLTVLFVFSVLCAAWAEETTTVSEKAEDTTLAMATRPASKPSTPVPELVHQMASNATKNGTVEVEKNAQRSRAAAAAASGLVLGILVLCAAF